MQRPRTSTGPPAAAITQCSVRDACRMMLKARAGVRNPLIADTAAVLPAPLPRGGGRCAMDDEALTRILDAVGSKFIPANLDLDGLRADIQLAALWWMQITGEKNQPARLRRLQDIRRAAEDLKRLLEEDAQSGLALSKYPFTGSDPLTMLNQLTNYVNRVLEPPEPPDGMQTRPVPLKGSAFDWAMLSLMELYSKYFRRKAGISRLGGKIDGPFIRFADAALRELKIFNDGKPYSRETIARAVTALKPAV